MATTAPDKFRRRARRAYEWARLKAGAGKALPALLLTAVSGWLCHELGLSVVIGAALFALATGLAWSGRVAGRAASAGLKAGMAAFALPVAAFNSYFGPYCSTLTAMLLINGGVGVGVGVLLSVESARLESQRNVFLLLASVVTALSGM